MRKSHQTSNNAQCSCGSGKVYNHCCARIFTALPPRNLTVDPLLVRNLQFLDFLNENFGLESLNSVSELKKRVTSKSVLKLYTRIAELFPPETEFEYLLPEANRNLRALFLGNAEPRHILNNVVRYSLYADEILVFNQFLNPWTVEPSRNPLLKPEIYKQHTLSNLVLIALLAPWLRSGLVHLIPDLGDFDSTLRYEFEQSATLRLANYKIEPDDHYMEEFESKFSRFVFAAPEAFLYQEFKKFYPAMTAAQLTQLVRAAKDMNNSDPLALADTTTEQVWIERGGNLEMAAFVAQATNAFPYTNLQFRWKEILECIQQFPSSTQPWAPLTESFQQLNFKFLDHVDPNFALKLKQDGRLNSFRIFLKKIWKVQESSDPSVRPQDFCDELKNEYAKAQADWDKLKGEELKSGGKLFASIGTGAGSLALGQLHLAIPSGGFAIQAVTELIASRFNRRAFRQSVPMSIFVDLAKGSRSKRS